jgi:hypothetical protein
VGAVVEADTVAVAASMAVADFTAALPVVDSVEAARVTRAADTVAVSAEAMEVMVATDTARI